MFPFKTTSLNVSAGAVIGTTLSAGNIIYAQGGNSNLWNSAYNISTAYQSASGSFAPIIHTHTVSDITDYPEYFPGATKLVNVDYEGGGPLDVLYYFDEDDEGNNWYVENPNKFAAAINAMSNTVFSSQTITGNTFLTNTDPNKLLTLNANNVSAIVYLPQGSFLESQFGNTLILAANFTTPSTLLIYRVDRDDTESEGGPYFDTTLLGTLRSTGQTLTFYVDPTLNYSTSNGLVPGNWRLKSVDNHTHTLSDITNAGTAAVMASGSFVSSTIYQNASGNWQGTYTTVQSNSANWTQTLFFTQSSDNLTITNGNSVSLAAYMQKPQISATTITSNTQLSGTNRFQWLIVNTFGVSVTLTLPTVGTGAQINDVIIIEGGGQLFGASIAVSGAFTNRTITRPGENYRWRYYAGGSGTQWYIEPNVTSHNSTHSSTGSDPITPGSILALPLSGGTLTGDLTVVGLISAGSGNSNLWNSTHTNVQSNSANWNFGYNVATYVQANSATWEESAEILPTVTNYLSTSNVLMSAVNVTTDIVANRIQATVKNFYIKHPLKPDKHLVYSSLESPYNGVQLTGEGEIVNGQCVVKLPDYLSSLIHSDKVHIQLTNYKHLKPLYIDSIEIDRNRFTVKCDGRASKSKPLKFFWLLNGVRKDIEELQTEV